MPLHFTSSRSEILTAALRCAQEGPPAPTDVAHDTDTHTDGPDLADPRAREYRDPGDDHDEIDEIDDPDADRRMRRSSRARRSGTAHLVREGASGRRDADRDGHPDPDSPDGRGGTAGGPPAESALSSYDIATHGPGPAPAWLVTSLAARDTPLGVLKTGKEADVGLLDRSVPGEPGCLLAVKEYRSAEHRLFHRDAGYLEGRRTRRSRESRAMAARTAFGRDLLSARWSAAEFAALGTLWSAGCRVPYPVQLIGTELMMEFVGTPGGAAAPRLATWDDDTAGFTALWDSLVGSLIVMAECGLAHGDLSPYNILVADGEAVLIDLPQVVDLVANPGGPTFLRRDCANVAGFFARRGVDGADGPLLAERLLTLARPTGR
ncbi:RIO kinase 1 [Nakamurella flavida]|nr:RIO1 family regulatory kinase/ATPase [Nakamurella flavida]MDP9776597.1 RIO kinase 1 [Nakamurella flavida]